MDISSTVGAERRVIECGISAFLEAQKINFRSILNENMINIAFFHVQRQI